jgi:hypothetical protein
MTTIANMTPDELKKFIEETVDQRVKELSHSEIVARWIKQMFGEFEFDEDELFPEEEKDTRSLEEVEASIRRNRWTPPPGAKSSLELLREDRDR